MTILLAKEAPGSSRTMSITWYCTLCTYSSPASSLDTCRPCACVLRLQELQVLCEKHFSKVFYVRISRILISKVLGLLRHKSPPVSVSLPWPDLLTKKRADGHKINQGIAEKLYTLVFGISLLISAYIVAIVIYWKLALIIMTIVPTIFLIMGGVIAIAIPIEARVVRHASCEDTTGQANNPSRTNFMLMPRRSLKMR
jgi:ABC-type multidrug transport system fused ATPase/permease subunit